VWWVDGLGCRSDGGFGTADDPYCTLAEAVANVGPGARGTIVVTAAPSASVEPMIVEAGTVLIVRGGGAPALRELGAVLVQDGAQLMLEGVHIGGVSGAPAIRCDGAAVWVDAAIVEGGDIGILAGACDVTVRRSRVHAATGAGIEAGPGSHLVVENTAITAGGPRVETASALVVDGAVAQVSYATIIGAARGPDAALRCTGEATVAVHSSIVAGAGSPSVACPALHDDYSWLDVIGAVGRGSHAEPLHADHFVDLSAGDVHLTARGALELSSTGQWVTGDPLVDLDGDARPGVHLAFDHPGADRPSTSP
jgi:hypothetical protein